MKKALLVLTVLMMHGVSLAQQGSRAAGSGLSYSYGELRFVDVDSNGGDGFRFAGSYEIDRNWLVVAALTSLDFNNNVDSSLLEVGAGYVWNYSSDFDFLSTLRFVRAEVDVPGGNFDDTGLAFSVGTRGRLTPQLEVRGSVNHINLDNSDTYLELAGDYHFSQQLSAGVSLEFAGDSDVFTIGGRWYFR